MGTPDGKPKPLVNLCLSWTKESTLPVFGTGDTPVRRLLPPSGTRKWPSRTGWPRATVAMPRTRLVGHGEVT